MIVKTCKTTLRFSQHVKLLTQVSLQSTATRWKSTKPSSMSYLCGPSDIPLQGVTVGRKFDEAVQSNPDREAFVFSEGKIRRTMGQFKEEVDQLASSLMNLGLKPGDRIGVWGPNKHEWVTAQYATAKAGLIMVNINPAYRVQELEFALKKVGVKALLAATKFKTSNYYEMLQEVCPEINNSGKGKLKSARVPSLETIIMMGDRDMPGAYSFTEVLNMGKAKDSRLEELSKNLQMDDIINIQFTSGTTGFPKGAALSHHNILNNAYFVGLRCEFDKISPKICVQVPFYHCFGMGLGNLQIALHNATCVYPSPGFDAEKSLQAIHEEGCNALYGTPTMFIDILNHPDLEMYNVDSLRTGVIAGSPCPEEVMKKIITDLHMSRITIAYGTTENGPVTFQGLPEDSLEKRCKTMGKPMPHTEVKIVDAEDRIVPMGERGEICIRGYCVMQGYFNDEEKTREVIKADRWYRTGDVGYLDEEEYGHITGRIKDMIIRGGENIYPTEIESFLHSHPQVADVQVIGIPDKRMGEEVCAVIKLVQGEKMTVDDLKHFCKGKIAHFKIPHYVVFVNEFPMTVTGKVQKYKLRDSIAKELGVENVKVFDSA